MVRLRHTSSDLDINCRSCGADHVCFLSSARYDPPFIRDLVRRFITSRGSSESELVTSRIQTASRVTTPTVSINRDLVRDGRFNFSDMQYLINWEV